MLLTFVASVDGEPLRPDIVDVVAGNAELVRAILFGLRTLFDTYRERGKIYVTCPGCRTWETEVPITAYALTIAAPIPSTFDGPFLTSPHLGARTLLGYPRAALPRTERVRLELPSAALDLPAPIREAVLGQVNYQPEESIDEVDDEDDHDDESEEEVTDDNIRPNRSGAGWRAVIRLSRALEPPLSVEDTEKLSSIDFFFLDLVHYLVALAPVRDDSAGVIKCQRCSTRFLPVRPGYRVR
jgi:hypothetical protein